MEQKTYSDGDLSGKDKERIAAGIAVAITCNSAWNGISKKPCAPVQRAAADGNCGRRAASRLLPLQDLP